MNTDPTATREDNVTQCEINPELWRLGSEWIIRQAGLNTDPETLSINEAGAIIDHFD